MKILAGLGNPGEKYINTRHNTGFILLDQFVTSHALKWQLESKFEAEISEYVTDQGGKYLLVKPQLYMNKSGEVISRIMNFYKIQPLDLYVIHDDVDLDFGRIKIQHGASSAGHRGVESIIDQIGSKNFWRVRIGIGRPEDPKIDTEDWVLMSLSDKEIDFLQKVKIMELINREIPGYINSKG